MAVEQQTIWLYLSMQSKFYQLTLFFPAHIQENIFDTYPGKIDIIFTKLNPVQYIMKHIF